MKTIIITGLSGAGKSLVVDIFEDLGYYCVDNLPPKLIEAFVGLTETTGAEVEKMALVTDIRGDLALGKADADFLAFLEERPDIKLLFLEADDDVLVARFQETRRRHPLAQQTGGLQDSIRLEREMLAAFRSAADEIIDTSHTTLKELRAEVQKVFTVKEESELLVTVSSFGFKYGMPLGADYVFDVRFLPNPFYKQELRKQTGEDQAVRDYVMSFAEARSFYNRVLDLLIDVLPQFKNVEKHHVEVAFGCTGGQHRSVTFTYLINEALEQLGYNTRVYHKDITKDRLER